MAWSGCTRAAAAGSRYCRGSGRVTIAASPAACIFTTSPMRPPAECTSPGAEREVNVSSRRSANGRLLTVAVRQDKRRSRSSPEFIEYGHLPHWINMRTCACPDLDVVQLPEQIARRAADQGRNVAAAPQVAAVAGTARGGLFAAGHQRLAARRCCLRGTWAMKPKRESRSSARSGAFGSSMMPLAQRFRRRRLRWQTAYRSRLTRVFGTVSASTTSVQSATELERRVVVRSRRGSRRR